MSELDSLLSESLSGVPMRRRQNTPAPVAPAESTAVELAQAIVAGLGRVAGASAERDDRLTMLVSGLVKALETSRPESTRRAPPVAFDLVRDARGDLTRVVPVYAAGSD